MKPSDLLPLAADLAKIHDIDLATATLNELTTLKNSADIAKQERVELHALYNFVAFEEACAAASDTAHLNYIYAVNAMRRVKRFFK